MARYATCCIVIVAALLLHAQRAIAQVDTLEIQKRLATNFALANLNAESVWLRLRALNSGASEAKRELFTAPPFELLSASSMYCKLVDSLLIDSIKVRGFAADIQRWDVPPMIIAVTDRFEVYPLFGFDTNYSKEFVMKFDAVIDRSFERIAKFFVALQMFSIGESSQFVQPSELCGTFGTPVIDDDRSAYKSITLWTTRREHKNPVHVHSVVYSEDGVSITTIRVR